MSIVLISGSLNLLEPSRPVQACNGIALSLYIMVVQLWLRVVELGCVSFSWSVQWNYRNECVFWNYQYFFNNSCAAMILYSGISRHRSRLQNHARSENYIAMHWCSQIWIRHQMWRLYRPNSSTLASYVSVGFHLVTVNCIQVEHM